MQTVDRDRLRDNGWIILRSRPDEKKIVRYSSGCGWELFAQFESKAKLARRKDELRDEDPRIIFDD